MRFGEQLLCCFFILFMIVADVQRLTPPLPTAAQNTANRVAKDGLLHPKRLLSAMRKAMFHKKQGAHLI
jgi:hypothetical protein